MVVSPLFESEQIHSPRAWLPRHSWISGPLGVTSPLSLLTLAEAFTPPQGEEGAGAKGGARECTGKKECCAEAGTRRAIEARKCSK